jgi:hypothetical protein
MQVDVCGAVRRLDLDGRHGLILAGFG